MQKGTVVEKLVEETANDDQHLKSLIRICEGKLGILMTNLIWLAYLFGQI